MSVIIDTVINWIKRVDKIKILKIVLILLLSHDKKHLNRYHRSHENVIMLSV